MGHKRRKMDDFVPPLEEDEEWNNFMTNTSDEKLLEMALKLFELHQDNTKKDKTPDKEPEK